MPIVRERPKGPRVQAERRRTIERHRHWAIKLTWPSPPGTGWLTEVRVASGLSASDVATRMAVSRSAVSYAEASERNGTIQLDVLRRYADAVDADVHCMLVPRATFSKQWTNGPDDEGTCYGFARPDRGGLTQFCLSPSG